LVIRKVGIFKEDAFWLFNTIGEYCIARKAEKELGSDPHKWRLAIKKNQLT